MQKTMINRILNKIAGDYNKKELERLEPIVRQINMIAEEYKKLSDEELQAKTPEFKSRLEKGETLDNILPEAFATVKVACTKLIGREHEVKGNKEKWFMVPYDVQLLAGIIIHQGKIAEMKTGEGKTIVATLPVYLNALSGKGVHVVTVNDYLSSRDAEWMWFLYEWLGLTIWNVVKWVPVNQRRAEYEKDITYIENSELGFDYLRDNLVKSMEERVLVRRPLNFAIIDEVDSILIDEARTPLIISEPREESTEKYQYYGRIVKSLSPCTTKKKVSKGLLHELMNEKKWGATEEDGDYYIDEKTKTAALSSRGIARLEKMLKIENLYKDIGYEEIHHIENALRAQAVYTKDKEYILQNGEVLIVDEHTGRAMPWRRFSEGLHQAIEAKEGVQIRRESRTMATITYQNFFKQYAKLAGMTGTAVTEAEEFTKIYELDVLEVTTNRPIIRVDKNDKVYFNQKGKRKFIKEQLNFYHEIGQPILIGASAIQTSEYISKLLDEVNINHYVLNAKFHEQEANIVANAGKFKSVVVATNMAWRGTDIKLEKDLNPKLAENYAKYVNKQLKDNKWVSAVIYSTREFELTMDGFKKTLDLSDEQIRQAEQQEIVTDNMRFKIKFNTKKKSATDALCEILVRPNLPESWKSSVIQKDFHYGLFILGTEKHESRRIDNQLRGRAGRQGDPGTSVFYVGLDDLLMRKMWGEKIQSLAWMLLPKDQLESLELTQKQFTSSIVRAQSQMEGRHFSIRKHLFDYDSVVNKQRQRIYLLRDTILDSEQGEKEEIQAKQKTFVANMTETLQRDIEQIIEKQIENARRMKQSTEDFLETVNKELNLQLASKDFQRLATSSYGDIAKKLPEMIKQLFLKKIKGVEEVRLYSVFKNVSLHYIDTLWVEHIDEMQYLRDKVWLMGYAQIDPLTMYKKEAYGKFQTLLYRLKVDTATTILNTDLTTPQQAEPNPHQIDQGYMQLLQQLAGSKNLQGLIKQAQVSAKEDSRSKIFEDEDGFEIFEIDDNKQSEQEIQVIDTVTNRKTRPNDPCPCGSGKKYKKCCGVK